MRVKTAQEAYESLKASGMMWVLWPEAKGHWDADKEAFSELVLNGDIRFRPTLLNESAEWPDVIE
jgi:hypothetical protein